ncbi:MAG: SDR family NAD(P)-dependent oxidoreductase [Anaerolineales bacterium]|nr:SDR family NAD(P)-dependent oxidoreductase [Chloroflexota bacterium]MBL6980655.1 SDR family NAD(P)-dependent oxidoreductase [Anaerolineales bacterium]
MDQFKDQVVLITGAGRGTGRALAEAFAAQGAIVAANDITPINLDETIQRIVQAGGRTKDYVLDISKKMPVQTMLNQVIDDWDQIDILINNAHVDPKKALLDLDEWDWRRAIDVNLTGIFLVAQSVGRIMREAGGGVMVNVLSGGEGQAALKSSRLGVLGLTLELAEEFSAYNIRINAVSTFSMGLASELRELAGEPNADIVEATLQLCSQAAEDVNGKILITL